MSPYAAVVFDLDDTLCAHDQSAETIYFGAFEAAGIDPFGTPDDLWAALEGSPDPDDEAGYLADGFERVARQYDRDVDAAALGRGFVETVDNAAVSLRPGARDALDAARANGRVGLLTNGPEHRQTTKVEALGVGPRFDAVVYAGDLPERKPGRLPFDRMRRALGVETDPVLYVGDSLTYDVAGARAAGWAAAWLPGDDGRDADGRPDPGDHDPDHVLDSLADLRGILADGDDPNDHPGEE